MFQFLAFFIIAKTKNKHLNGKMVLEDKDNTLLQALTIFSGSYLTSHLSFSIIFSLSCGTSPLYLVARAHPFLPCLHSNLNSFPVMLANITTFSLL